MNPREAMNKLKWSGAKQLRNVKVTILHRGAPNDRRVVDGEDILELERGFMRVVSPEGEAEIPYHRILQIESGGRVVWKKRG
jgi:uncharacterized protein (UPF0248 family)